MNVQGIIVLCMKSGVEVMINLLQKKYLVQMVVKMEHVSNNKSHNFRFIFFS